VKAGADTVRVRPAGTPDRAFVLETAPRLAAFGPPEWRTPDEVVEGEARTLRAFFERPPDGAALLVAETGALGPAGFAYLETLRDYFTGEAHAHVGILAVSENAEGRGVGSALLAAAEDWARGRGARKLTLNVFEGNRRARALYERRGFLPESLRYVRRLERS
jgi:GNAT superfamily N-acetyltransferase